MGREPEQIFFQRKYTDSKQTNEKMFNITNHQGNVNQNHNEIWSYTCHNGQNQNKTKQNKTKKQEMTSVGKYVEKEKNKPCALLVGM